MGQRFFLLEIESARSTRQHLHKYNLNPLFHCHEDETTMLFIITKAEDIHNARAEIFEGVGLEEFDHFLRQVDISNLADGLQIDSRDHYATQMVDHSLDSRLGATFEDNAVLYYLKSITDERNILVQGSLYDLPLKKIRKLAKMGGEFRVYRIIPDLNRTVAFSSRYADWRPRIYGKLCLDKYSWKYTLFANLVYYLPNDAEEAYIGTDEGNLELLDMLDEDVDVDWIPTGTVVSRDEYGFERDWGLHSKSMQFGGTLNEMLDSLNDDHTRKGGGDDWLEGIEKTSDAPTEWRLRFNG